MLLIGLVLIGIGLVATVGRGLISDWWD